MKKRRTNEMLERIRSYNERLDNMTTDQLLDWRMKQAQKANKDWKWEFQRQQNLLKKQISISLKKERFFKSNPARNKHEEQLSIIQEEASQIEELDSAFPKPPNRRAQRILSKKGSGQSNAVLAPAMTPRSPKKFSLNFANVMEAMVAKNELEEEIEKEDICSNLEE